MRRHLFLFGATCLALLVASCGGSSSQSSAGSNTHSSRAGHHSHRSHRSRSTRVRHSRSHTAGFFHGPVYAGTSAASRVTGPSKLLGPRSKTSGCQAHGALQDRACTPGATFAGVTRQQVCVLGYSKRVRNVPSATKRQVFAEYGITSHSPGQYEVDHLVSLELGGSNSIANLWPEAASPQPGFHQKDQVENYLHNQMCSGRMSLQQADQAIATNWLSVFKKMGR